MNARLSVLLVAGLLSTSLFAAPAKKDQPCKRLVAACQAGGFTVKDNVPGKSLHMDCMRKLLAGNSVDGVKAAPNDIEACRAKKDKSRAHAQANKWVPSAAPASKRR